MSDDLSDITLNLDESASRELARCASAREMSPTRMVREVIENWLSEQKQHATLPTPEERSPMQCSISPHSVFKVTGWS